MHIFDTGSYMVNWSPNLQTAVSDLVPNTCPSISHNGNSSLHRGGGGGDVSMATPHRLTETTGSGGVQEVEYSEEPGKLYYFKYHVAGGTRYTRTLLE